MIELNVSRKTFNDCITHRRSFLITNNWDLSIQPGDHIRIFEREVGAKEDGRSVEIVVTYVTNYEQKENFIVFQFNLVSSVRAKETKESEQ